MTTPIKPVNHRARWSATDDTTLLTLYGARVNIEYIAEELQRTVVAVLGRLKHHGLIYFDTESNSYFTAPALVYKF